MTHKRPRRLTLMRRNDSGSILLAFLAALIVLGMLTVLSTTAMVGQKTARHDRDFSSVFQVADAGVQRVLFVLNSSKNATGVTSTMTGTIRGGTYSAYAVKTVNSREWTIYSTATLRGVTRQVAAIVQEDKLFFASAFADTSVGFNGGNTANTYNSGADGTTAFTPQAGVYGLVGSNGPVTFLGNSTLVDGIQLWKWKSTDTIAARCSGQASIGLVPTMNGCSDTANTTYNSLGVAYQQRLTQTRVLTPSTADLASKAASCGNQNAFVDLTINQATSLSPASVSVQNQSVAPTGTAGQNGYIPGYYCYNNVTINANVTLAGASLTSPVILYVAGNVSIRGNGTLVNCVNCDLGPQTPNAAALQIYMINAKTFDAGSQEKFGVGLYAPTSTCSGGAGDEIYGSMICGSIANVGNWGFHFDKALENLGNSQFSLSDYRDNS